MFHIVGTHIDLPVLQAFVEQDGRGVQALAKDGIIVFHQVLYQSLRAAGVDDIRCEAQLSGKGIVALIVFHLVATFQDLLLASTVLKAVQMHLDASLGESFHPIKHIDNPTVVGRIRHIEGDDMEVVFTHSVGRFQAVSVPRSPNTNPVPPQPSFVAIAPFSPHPTRPHGWWQRRWQAHGFR